MRALKQMPGKLPWRYTYVTTQAHEGIETEKGAGTETGDEVTTQETPGGQAPLTKHEQKFE